MDREAGGVCGGEGRARIGVRVPDRGERSPPLEPRGRGRRRGGLQDRSADEQDAARGRGDRPGEGASAGPADGSAIAPDRARRPKPAAKAVGSPYVSA